MDVERNDVDVSRLFKWGKVFEISDSAGELQALVYMKLLGDADVNRARVYALRKSAELRRELSNPDSDLRWATIRQIDVMTEDDIANYILVFSMRDITNRALKEIDIPFPKMPKSNAALSKLEKYQREVDEYPAKKGEAVNKFIQKEVDKLKKYLLTEPKEVIYKQYVNTLIDEFCEREALKAYNDMEVYLGCFKDDTYKEHFFETFEDFDNLGEEQKSEFKTAYSKISIGMDELKKLREATQ